jgi:hypothetical protein
MRQTRSAVRPGAARGTSHRDATLSLVSRLAPLHSRTDQVNDNARQPFIGRLKGTLHLETARLMRDRAMQTQRGVEETLRFRAELRRSTDILPAAEPT